MPIDSRPTIACDIKRDSLNGSLQRPICKDYDGGGRYQYLVDQVSKQLGELRLGENY